MTASTSVEQVNILLVDDQPSKLLTYQAILGELGENLITAASANEALECLLRHEIAVVLVDVCMPEFDGYELASMIRQHPRYQKTSIIFVSAILMTDLDRLRGYECGAVDYVPVPVVPEILRAKVSVFADLYRKTRALERVNDALEARVAERTAELEATTAALQEASRRKDEFLAMLAHELRNPLAPIRTAVQILQRDGATDKQRAQARDIIERQADHLVCLIDDLLDVSRITRGMITLHREPLAVDAVVARAVEVARPTIDAKGHELTLEMPEEAMTVDGDRTRLVQAVGNVLQNAAKFTEDGGRIRLALTAEDGHAVIRVTDSGIGIPAESLPHVFDLFTRLHTQSDAGQGGLGIGLALVRRLVEMHGGAVEVRSDGPGRGAEFTLRLPLVAAAPVVEPEVTTALTIGPRRILIADDNHDAASALATLLGLHGHAVQVVHDGSEALSAAQSFRPHLVLLDLGMPKLDGYETARRMRRELWGKEATVVAVTGWGQQQDRDRTADAGFDGHLVKPILDDDLLSFLAAREG